MKCSVVLVLILASTEYTLSDELENGLPVHMNLLGILSLPRSTCVTWIPQRTLLVSQTSKEQNSLASWQNPQGPGYQAQLSMHDETLCMCNSIFKIFTPRTWKIWAGLYMLANLMHEQEPLQGSYKRMQPFFKDFLRFTDCTKMHIPSLF